MKSFCILLSVAALVFTPLVPYGADGSSSRWQDSIIRFDATRNVHNFRVPWDKRAETVNKFGAVIEGNEVLTTARGLANHTLVRLQKGGRGRWYNGTVRWVDYQANLAFVGVEDSSFWEGLKPVGFATADQLRNNLKVVRWRAGNIERRAAEFSRFTVADANFNQAPRIELKASSEMEGGGQSELMVAGDKVAGLVASKSGSTCSVIPSPFISAVLELRAAGSYRGLGYFDFIWQPASNPAITDYFKLSGPARGALVIKTTTRPGIQSPLQLHDIILEVDGFPIDTQGDYLDPDYGHVIMEYLACRSKWAGDVAKLKVWRDGVTQEIQYRLPKADFTGNLVTDRSDDAEPTYLIAGGLVFVPLSAEYLSSWGKDWQRSAPFRLVHYNNQKPEKEQRSLVVLSLVLPDVYNIGYQDRNAQNLVLDQANGQRIDTLESLANALSEPDDDFHILKFKKGSALRKIVLDVESLDEANQRIAKRYRITEMRNLE